MRDTNCDNCVSEPAQPAPESSHASAERSPWHRVAAADFALCELFAERHCARLTRSLRCQRVGWRVDAERSFGILMPIDPRDRGSSASVSPGRETWSVYVNNMETVIAWSAKERERYGMLILPDAAEDWMELIRQAIYRDVYDITYTISPIYLDASGETCHERTGYIIDATGASPIRGSTAFFATWGTGITPESAARDLCQRWLRDPTQLQSL